MSSRLNYCTLFLFVFVLLLTSCSTSKSVNDDIQYQPSIKETKLSKSEKTLINEAKSWLGTPYKYGGHSKEGTDCSGFVMKVYLAVYNKKLPRSSKDQHAFCKKISKDKMKVGDLVFFATGNDKNVVSHVGIYIGNDEFIHASSNKGVVVSSLSQSYYVRTFVSAGRVEGVYK